MKRKKEQSAKTTKKLVLGKETVRNLDKDELKTVAGASQVNGGCGGSMGPACIVPS